VLIIRQALLQDMPFIMVSLIYISLSLERLHWEKAALLPPLTVKVLNRSTN